jgi:hypothetical protein
VEFGRDDENNGAILEVCEELLLAAAGLEVPQGEL